MRGTGLLPKRVDWSCTSPRCPSNAPWLPFEFIFLADDYFRRKGLRDRVELVYATPLSDAFTKPIAAEKLGGMLAERGIRVEADFYVERVDGDAIVSYDERSIPFDLLVTMPVNMGASYVGRSRLGNELNHVRVDTGTFLVEGQTDVFAVGDAAALPTSGLVLANAALGEGIETHLFFTFWGFDIINRKTMGHMKFSRVGNPATHMPPSLMGLPAMTA